SEDTLGGINPDAFDVQGAGCRGHMYLPCCGRALSALFRPRDCGIKQKVCPPGCLFESKTRKSNRNCTVRRALDLHILSGSDLSSFVQVDGFESEIGPRLTSPISQGARTCYRSPEHAS